MCMPSRSTRISPPLLLIENISPAVDGGRYAAKRIVGDLVEIGADIIKDGHDLVAGAIRYRAVGEGDWQQTPLTYDYNPDRWVGSFVVDRVMSWEFLIEAWLDVFGTWRSELGKKFDAGQDVSLELSEGAALLEGATRRARGDDRTALRQHATSLRDPASDVETRVRQAMAEDLGLLLARYVDPKLVMRSETYRIVVDAERARFAAWYEMFPRSQATEPGRHGTFADAERQLPRLADLGFDVIYLPPIHPIGHTFRKGKNNSLAATPDDVGSPWAIGSELGGHTAIEPRLGTFTDFDRFVAAARRLGMDVALDYALQCSPDHPWVREHPDWFFIRADGSIKYAENPPKKYQDIYPLDFWCADREGLWNACRDIVRFWIGHGVRTFRVDNPHTKPLAFWRWMIEEIKRDDPDVIFLAEAFTRPKRMKALAKLGFTQSYSYFTWRNNAWELREYLTELTRTEMVEYYRPNFFANTPDILHEYLQKGGRPAFLVRLLLAATLSPLYGIYSGFELGENVPAHAGSEEYVDSEKYELKHRDWNAPGNLGTEMARLNRIRRENPALQQYANLSFHHCDNDNMLFYVKRIPGNVVMIVVNLDPTRPQEGGVRVPLADLELGVDEQYVVKDLVTDESYRWRGENNFVRLDPSRQVAHVLRLERE